MVMCLVTLGLSRFQPITNLRHWVRNLSRSALL